jgi:hypothetical protein
LCFKLNAIVIMKPVAQEYFARLTKPIQLPPLKAPNLPRKSAMRLNAHVMPDRSATPSPRLDRARRTSLGLFDRREEKKRWKGTRSARYTDGAGRGGQYDS